MANTLNEVELLEQRIAALDNAAFATLRDWFIEFEQSRRRGKFDANAAENALEISSEQAFDDVESPDWHGQILADRMRRVQAGEIGFTDWETAKQEIQNRIR